MTEGYCFSPENESTGAVTRWPNERLEVSTADSFNWRRGAGMGRHDVRCQKARFNSTQIQPHNATGGP